MSKYGFMFMFESMSKSESMFKSEPMSKSESMLSLRGLILWKCQSSSGQNWCLSLCTKLSLASNSVAWQAYFRFLPLYCSELYSMLLILMF
jgi:hypothetical protein